MKFSVPFLLLCLALAGCLKTPGKGPWSKATGAEEHERLMWQAIHDKKWNEVENHLAATFVGVDTHGQSYDRAWWIEHWKRMDVRDFSLGELTVQPNGPDMVITYKMQLRGEESGQSIPDAAVRVVSVWQGLKHGWVMVSQAMTPVKSN